MRRREKIRLRPKHGLIIGLVVCLVLILISFRFNKYLYPVRNAVGSAITPMQKGINIIGTYISDGLATLKSIEELAEENKRLKEQVDILSYENKLLLQNKYELDELRELYKLDQKYIDYPKVAARIIDKDTNNWYNVFTIDKGTRDGLSAGMNVIAGDGLVGIITECYYNHSKVRAIIDDKSAVWGMFLKTSDTCVVQGDLKLMEEGKLRVEFISKDAEVEEGYEIVTAHTSPNFLEGILIGYVTGIELDPSTMTKKGYLIPAVDFERLSEVLIITELKEPLLTEPPEEVSENEQEK
ncbi:MAG: rod shape-determining protein MreC [Clostridiales bacterium]|jgi:rod shape-determining protein MreC|nr:rod shape-determining protein MreC [Clostridiales bacterium]